MTYLNFLDSISLMMVLDIKTNHDITKLSTLRIKASAEYFVSPNNLEDLVDAIKEAQMNNWTWNILGAGSNLLLSSRGIPGLMIASSGIDYLQKINFTANNEEYFEVGAGMRMPRFCALMSRESLAGTEFMEGIPGSIGGGIVMNAGAHGSEITSILAFAKLLNLETLELELWANSKFINENKLEQIQLTDLINKISQVEQSKLEPVIRSNLELKYRVSSIDPAKYFILSGIFHLTKDDKEAIRNRVVHNNLARTTNQPIKSWTCGCTFKNPQPSYGAGKLIQDLGLKGYVYGDFRVSDLHANFFENTDEGSSIEFCELIRQVQEKALQEKSIKLSPEVQRMGIFTAEEEALWDE
jgi:UDP-N-acetylmuramate dehydrogenase